MERSHGDCIVQDNSITIAFPDTSTAEGNLCASSLIETLRDIDPNVQAETARLNPDAQDFGATIVLVLGTASVTAIANGIAAWIGRHNTKIIIRKNGAVVATGLDSADAARIAEAISRK
jgi:hypothetical protein